MGKQRLRWTGEGLQFEGEATWGIPIRIGGDRKGPGAKPADLLPISLAACTCYDVVKILKEQQQDLQGLEVKIESHQLQEPPFVFERIHLRFVIRGDVDKKKARKAVELAESTYCSVAATIRPTVEITHEVDVIGV